MEKFTFFWRTASPFSQWHKCNFIVDQILFNCTEQYMMFMKAKLFEDHLIAEKILKSSSPSDQKKLGRKVKNFDQEIWESNCKKIVYDGNFAKFTQNKQLKQKLLETKGTTIVEASPVDPIWGVGLSEDNPKILNRKTWKGTNWLGEILTQIREDMIVTEK
ncbi:NADAR family protein [Chengkuizengella sediminis]|uniref:NADAR family protein n=1 Tax=Chengkuizengella sediminis TaxID=1885917 RepID=UPI00138A6117|nr:NADAR family protein [Chengkuizengella sediminis]NDI35490.1 NADAR family protein [Chengkuizengella sediminis]